MLEAIRDKFVARMQQIPAVERCEFCGSGNQFTCILLFRSGTFKVLDGIYLKDAFPAELRILGESSLVLTPQMSAAGRRVCEECGISYMDAAGNCLVALEEVYLSESGQRQRGLRARRGATSVFEPTSHVSSRLLRMLMQDAARPYPLSLLAQDAACSTAQVYKVARFLEQHLMAENRSGKLCITDAARLMQEWAAVVAKRSRRTEHYYTTDSLEEAEAKLRELRAASGDSVLLTGICGGNRYAPAVRYHRLHLLGTEEQMQQAVRYLGCRPCSSGANIVFIVNEAVETQSDWRELRGEAVASPVQVYLDCCALAGRGEEQADAVYRKEIAPHA